MKSDHILRAINDVDAALLENAEPGRRPKRRAAILKITAAICAVLLIAALAAAVTAVALHKKNPVPTQPSGASEGQTETPGPATTPEETVRMNGLIFAVNPDYASYALVGVEDSATGIDIPAMINGLPVTEVNIGVELVLDQIHMYTFSSNIVIIDNRICVFPMVGGEYAVGEDDPDLIAKSGCLIDKKTGTLIRGTENAVIPDDGSVRAIGENAFIGNRDLKTLTVPEGVTRIGENAFSGCKALESVELPASLESVEKDAFFGCRALKTVDAPSLDAWKSIEFAGFTSNPLHTGADLYAGGEQIPKTPEPDKAADPSAWIAWLKDDLYSSCSAYKTLSGGEGYKIRMSADEDFSCWEYRADSGSFCLIYAFDGSADIYANVGDRYPYVWEIFYRKAGTSDAYESIVTKPQSTYRFDLDELILFRLPTYQDGMTDLETANGAPQDYEFVFVISNKSDGAVQAWYYDVLTVNEVYEYRLNHPEG